MVPDASLVQHVEGVDAEMVPHAALVQDVTMLPDTMLIYDTFSWFLHCSLLVVSAASGFWIP